jgi:hypothetical protein
VRSDFFPLPRALRFRLELRGLDTLYPVTLQAPIFPGSCYTQPFRLSRQSGGFGGSPCRAVSVQESSFCISGRSAAIGKVVVSEAIQIFVLVIVLQGPFRG